MELSSRRRTVDVDTGEIRVSSEPVILQAIALGSCVAMAVYERNKKIGGLAHIMLPGKSPSSNSGTKYAEDAIESLIESVKTLGAEIGDMEINVVGGANILQEGDIPDKVIESVLGYLKTYTVDGLAWPYPRSCGGPGIHIELRLTLVHEYRQ